MNVDSTLIRAIVVSHSLDLGFHGKTMALSLPPKSLVQNLGLGAFLLSVVGCAVGEGFRGKIGSSDPPAVSAESASPTYKSNSSSNLTVQMVGFQSPVIGARDFQLEDGVQETGGTQEPSDASNSAQQTGGKQTGGKQIGETENEDASQSSEEADRHGQDTATPTAAFAVNDYVSLALSRHPKIVAANHRLSAAQNRIVQARSLADPMLSETFWPFNGNALETAAGRTANQLAISQAVPWPEKLTAREAIACRDAQVIEAEVQRIRLEITESVQLACYEIWFATRTLALVEDSKQLVDDLIEFSEARYRSGGSQQDVLRAQIEADRLSERLVQLRQQKRVAQADLATLLQTPREAEFEVAFDSANITDLQALDALIAQAEGTNPELRGLRSQISRDRAKQRLASLQKYPDFQVGMNWMMVSDQNAISPVATGNDNFGFTVGMSLPVYREKIDAGIRESAHISSSTASLLESERDTIAGKLRRLLAQADSLLEQERIYTERIIPRTQDALRLSLADYRGQKAEFTSVIDIHRELLQLEIQLARLHASRAANIAQIERTVGLPGDRF